MEIEMDSDVKAVVEFMQITLPAARLVAVSDAVQKVAPVLWGHYPTEEVQALRLRAAISVGGPRTQSIASGYALGQPCADDDSAAVVA